MRKIGWRFWVIVVTVIVAYMAAGWKYAAHAPANLLFDIGTLGTFFAAVLFIAVYTALGLRGPAKWWQNDVGVNLVLAVAALLPVTGPLAWAVIFHHGLLDTPLDVWIEIGGMFMSCLMILGLSWLWLWHRPDGSVSYKEARKE